MEDLTIVCAQSGNDTLVLRSDVKDGGIEIEMTIADVADGAPKSLRGKGFIESAKVPLLVRSFQRATEGSNVIKEIVLSGSTGGEDSILSYAIQIRGVGDGTVMLGCKTTLNTIIIERKTVVEHILPWLAKVGTDLGCEDGSVNASRQASRIMTPNDVIGLHDLLVKSSRACIVQAINGRVEKFRIEEAEIERELLESGALGLDGFDGGW